MKSEDDGESSSSSAASAGVRSWQSPSSHHGNNSGSASSSTTRKKRSKNTLRRRTISALDVPSPSSSSSHKEKQRRERRESFSDLRDKGKKKLSAPSGGAKKKSITQKKKKKTTRNEDEFDLFDPFSEEWNPAEAAGGASSSSSLEEEGGGEGEENIRVVCRFRPHSQDEYEAGGEPCIAIPNQRTVTVQTGHATSSSHSFNFHRVFSEYSGQEEVYTYAAKPMIDDVLNGYSAAIIAYGQTGAGKTYTMQGPGFEDAELHRQGFDEGLKGIIPRVMGDIFHHISTISSEHILFDITVSYLEIYMEKVRDLLNLNRDPNRSLTIRGDKTGLIVPEAMETPVFSAEQVISVMRDGARNRVKKHSNEESSRGHAIFLVTINKQNIQKQTTKASQLYLVDLAGSEKVSKTEAEGMRLDEAKRINASLLALGNVISALVARKKHVPYRDSKLTRLLQNSLGGNARTTLVINCSPSSFNVTETLSTLRFGSRASLIRNKPKQQQIRTPQILEAMLFEAAALARKQHYTINQLQSQILQLQEALASSSSSSSSSSDKEKEKEKDKETDAGTTDQSKENRISLYNIDDEEEEGLVVQRKVEQELEHRKRAKGVRQRYLFHFICPLTQVPFEDPVVAMDGHTYERKAIEQWLARHSRSPLTGNKLPSRKIIPNYNMRRYIHHKRLHSRRLRAWSNLFACLPDELLCHIFEFLDASSLVSCTKVCILFATVLRDYDNFWKRALHRHFTATEQSQGAMKGSAREEYLRLFHEKERALITSQAKTTNQKRLSFGVTLLKSNAADGIVREK
ncbi:Kinesin-related protein 3 [Balamuthia mandrillaris]